MSSGWDLGEGRAAASMLWSSFADVSNHVRKPCLSQNWSRNSVSISTPSMSRLFASSTTGSGSPFGRMTFESISRFHFSTVRNVSGRLTS